MRHEQQKPHWVLATARTLAAAAVVIATAIGCGGDDSEVAEPLPSVTPSVESSMIASPTIEEPTVEPTDDVATEPAADVDSLCQDAWSAINDVPTGGSSDADFAIEEYAVSEILRDLSEDLATAGASDLGDAVADYAESRAAMAVAYDEGSYDGVTAASDEVEISAAEVAAAAAVAGAPTCEVMVTE